MSSLSEEKERFTFIKIFLQLSFLTIIGKAFFSAVTYQTHTQALVYFSDNKKEHY